MKKRIGIFTSFYNFDPAYSLCSVVRDQLTMLLRNGYEPVLFVLPSFTDEELVPKGTEIRKTVPQIILEPYKELGFPQHWKEDKDKVKEAVIRNCGDIDILICHDIFFIDTFIPYNIGIREATETCKFRILAWTHSAPSQRPELVDNPHANRFCLPPRTTLVYLNHDKANALAEYYGAWLKDVRVAHNARDPRTFWDLHPLTLQLIDKYDILSADIISTYPLSTPRMISGKGLDKVIRLHAKLKQLGYKTRLIVCNAHANATKDKGMIADTRVWAAEQGITHEELIFTSQEGKEYEAGVPGKVISDSFRLSNIFFFPTVSENSSLVLLEAGLAGNLLVLNEAVGTLREHIGTPALYFNFDYQGEKALNESYYMDLAKIVASVFENDRALQSKRTVFQKYNLDTVFKKGIEPLFYEYEA